ncbi:MAG: Trk system potassium transporter TrkA [Pseudomonadota bacterium]
MKVIICGAGQVGWQIAKHLSGEKNDVTVVDMNGDLVRRATDALDVQGITGHASYPDILKRAGADDADMVIAATHSDEVNMVTCQVAHSIFEIPRKIARLRAQSYLDAIYADIYRRDHLPIDVVISPEKEVAEAALRRINAPAAFDTELFFGGKAQLLGINIEDACPVMNTPLRQLTELFSTLRARIVGIRREGKLFAPDADDQIIAGDSCYFMSHIEDVPRTLEVFGKTTKKQERIVILGGGNVGLRVARTLESRTERVRARVIEKNRACAERAADVLEKTIVLHGDGLDSALMTEAGVQNADALLAVTDDDKTNILAAIRAKQAGAQNAICLINDPTLVPLLDALNIDAYINPRSTTVSSILRHIRHGRVKSVYSIGDAEAELIEAQVLSTSPIAGEKIGDIDFPRGVLVGAVQSGKDVVAPVADTVIKEGDVVAIFSLTQDVTEVERLLQVSIDFF